MKKKIILVLVFCLALSGIWYFKKDIKKEVILEERVEIRENTADVKENVIRDKVTEIKTVPMVTLEVLGEKYRSEVKEGDTVYLVMKRLEERERFSFNYKEYPSMGIFVDEINGVKGEPGKYWIYYVNGVEASFSVSKYLLKEGDVISWKQE